MGSTKDTDLDVRIIIATNVQLWDGKLKGALKFREDLFHRFNEFSITVPPLRDRKEDISVFSQHFLQVTNADLDKHVKGFTPEVEKIFQNYVWYGNLRELKNVIKRSVLLSDGEMVEVRTLPFEITNFSKLQFEDPHQAEVIAFEENSIGPVYSDELSLKGAGIDAEYELILTTLKKVKFNKTKAAKLLHIDRKTLYNKLDQYQLLNEK